MMLMDGGQTRRGQRFYQYLPAEGAVYAVPNIAPHPEHHLAPPLLPPKVSYLTPPLLPSKVGYLTSPLLPDKEHSTTRRKSCSA